MMTGYNLIVIYNCDKTKILLCKRIKEPYLGMYNFVGGHIENNESGEDAAYRELYEETSIGRDDVKLSHLMDFTYYNQDCRVEVWCGRLNKEKEVSGSENPLCWADADTSMFDLKLYAGEGNMGHILEQIRRFGKGFLN